MADVVYYYGERVPNFVAPKNTRFSVGPGYDYEIINTDILLNDLRVEDGQLQLSNGARFKLLSLGENTKISPAALEKLGQLSRQGAIVVGATPEEALGLSNQPQATQRVKSLADSLGKQLTTDLTATQLRQGGMYEGITAQEVLTRLQIPADFRYADPASGTLDFAHYQDQELDFYLVSNTTDQWVSRACTFRQRARCRNCGTRKPGRWFPWASTGQSIRARNCR